MSAPSNGPALRFWAGDAGEVTGIGPLGVSITDDPLPVFAGAHGVLDFTSPAASVEFAGLAAQARIVHVIGTTGCSAEDEDKIRAAARHATIVKSGNMSLGVNLLSVLVQKAAQALDPADFDIEILEMHHKHKVDAPSGTALLLGEAAAKGRDIALAENSVRVRDGYTGPRETGSIGFATLRGGSVIGEHSVILAGPGERIVLSPPCRRPLDLCARCDQGRTLGLWQKARPLFDAGCSRAERLIFPPEHRSCQIGAPEFCFIAHPIRKPPHTFRDALSNGALHMSRTLVLVRHGQSEWNLKNLFTGWRDPGLTEQGHAEAKAAGQRLKAAGLKFDIAYTSALSRAQVTCQHILDELGQSNLETIRDQALNERDYGDLSGLNKDDARAKWGEEQVHIWRRSYDVPPPGGESLKDTGARAYGPIICTRCSRMCCAARRFFGRRTRQFSAGAHHGAGRPDPGTDSQAGTQHRRSGHLPAQC